MTPATTRTLALLTGMASTGFTLAGNWTPCIILMALALAGSLHGQGGKA
ncbi:MAG: hypothetical protein SOI64_07565 [Bifidobacterium mongoliense]|jgi:hypothetical protein